MIVITGTAGFIGSCLLNKMNNKGYKDIIIVDDFSNPSKNKNFKHKVFREKIHRDNFIEWLENHHSDVEFIFHIGARTDTTEFNIKIFNTLNLNYSKSVWNACVEYDIPLIYASSAATYGLGELGYKDDHAIVDKLKPLNPYGVSKNDFDKWVLKQEQKPVFWAGFKFFNVYGPNEYHKGRMASVIFHAFKQIKETGKVKLFRSHNPDYEDGKQLRDFIYVKDVVDVLFFMMDNKKDSGIYNLGTGKARSFLDLATATFKSMDLKPDIEFVDTPLDIRDKYQYFTEAEMGKLRSAGYNKNFYSLEEGIEEYVQEHLIINRFY
ncbi:MAG: ADP-glyceromanno-heptose 6-epimerase [Bacteroidetes bacterium 4484_249]|nr:MAG: ADP-glyceromanno-heptose 6-epimerase [Bacteroidetes bacterium 4484_249]